MDNFNRVEKAYFESPNIEEYANKYIQYISEILDCLDRKAIAQFIEVIIDARTRGANIYFIGNGGSAATASHFANDLSAGTRSWDRPFKAVSLADNNAVLTAIGNDCGFDEVFLQQLRVHLKQNDVVVAISASGNSPNILKAIEYANVSNAITVGLTGFDGGILRKIVKYSLHVPSNKGEYGPVEDVHMIIDHLLYGYLLGLIKNEKSMELKNEF